MVVIVEHSIFTIKARSLLDPKSRTHFPSILGGVQNASAQIRAPQLLRYYLLGRFIQLRKQNSINAPFSGRVARSESGGGMCTADCMCDVPINFRTKVIFCH